MGLGNDAITLSFLGNLTITRIDELRAEVLAAMEAHQIIVLDCDGAEEIDLTFLQILIAATRSADALGKKVCLASPPSGCLADAIARCGFPPVAATTSLAQIFSLL